MKTRGVSAGSRSLSRCVVVASCAGFALAWFSALPGDALAAEVSASRNLRENPRGECLLVTSDGAALRIQPSDKGKILDKLAQGRILRLSPDEDSRRGDWFEVYEEYGDCQGMTYLYYAYGVSDVFYVHKKDAKRVDCPEPEEPSDEERAFDYLCQKGAPEAVRQALKDGGTPDACLFTAVEYNDDPETLRAVVEAGADVNARKKCSGGDTALMLLAAMPIHDPNAGETAELKRARKSVHDKVAVLLSAGADINARDDAGTTALIFAAHQRKPANVDTLLKAGADVNARDDAGTTALMVAAYVGEPAIVDTLLKAGADSRLKDKKGRDALWYARHHEIDDIRYARGDKMDKRTLAAIVRLLQGGDGKKSAPKRR